MSAASRALAAAWIVCILAYVLDWQVSGILQGALKIITPLLATFTVYIIARETAETRRGRIEQALGGKIHERTLNQILSNQSEFDFVASEQVVTLMFIDIVGFSKASETQSPKEAFSNLKELLGSLTKTVQDHGGIVDKSLGDGLLCYFGYYCAGMDCIKGSCQDRGEGGKCAQHCAKSSWVHNHAERAVRCALDIQKSNSVRMNHADRVSITYWHQYCRRLYRRRRHQSSRGFHGHRPRSKLRSASRSGLRLQHDHDWASYPRSTSNTFAQRLEVHPKDGANQTSRRTHRGLRAQSFRGSTRLAAAFNRRLPKIFGSQPT